MSAGIMKIDLNDKNDACRHFLVDFVKCGKDKSREESDRQCLHFGESYLSCRTDPKTYKLAGNRRKI